MKAAIPINDHEFIVDFSKYGLERYFLDGELLQESWFYKIKSSKEFLIDGQRLLIEVRIWPTYYCKAFLNGELYIEELFPRLKAWLSPDQAKAAEEKRVQFIDEKINIIDSSIKEISELTTEDKDSFNRQQQQIFALNENAELLLEERDYKPEDNWFTKLIRSYKTLALLFWLFLVFCILHNAINSETEYAPVDQCEPKGN